jgi:hypothetical protein
MVMDGGLFTWFIESRSFFKLFRLRHRLVSPILELAFKK